MQESNRNIKPMFIGHVSCDMVDGKCVLGGAVSYAATLCAQLGIQSRIITSCSPDFEGLNLLASLGIHVENIESERTTTFTNIYMGNERTQYVTSVAEPIPLGSLSLDDADSSFIFVAPIAQEFDPALIHSLSEKHTVACSIQGWLRCWDDEGKVKVKSMDWDLIKEADIIFLSEEDIEGLEDARQELIDLGAIIVITDNEHGAKIYMKGKEHYFPAYPSQLVDATGAGDIFATAFLIKYIQEKDIGSAAIFAHCAASIAIENKGMKYPSLSENLERRVEQYTTLHNL